MIFSEQKEKVGVCTVLVLRFEIIRFEVMSTSSVMS